MWLIYVDVTDVYTGQKEIDFVRVSICVYEREDKGGADGRAAENIFFRRKGGVKRKEIQIQSA